MDKLQLVHKFNTCFNVHAPLKTVFELGGELEDAHQRANQALRRANEIFDYVLMGKGYWLILFGWIPLEEAMQELEQLGVSIASFSLVEQAQQTDLLVDYDVYNPAFVQCLYANNYNFNQIKPLMSAIINNEMGVEPYTNLRAYVVSFDSEAVFVNLYDDRGMEVLLVEVALQNEIKAHFRDYLS